MERVALYSHDTQGLGHVRRNIAIAGTLAQSGRAVLLLSGVHEAVRYTLPPGVDFMSVPGVAKLEDGSYAPRSLGLPLEQVIALRAQVLRAALTKFEPEVLIVDKVPLGLLGELRPALTALRSTGDTRFVLGLRDVLDAPSAVSREWDAADRAALRSVYDEIWIYGDPNVYDAVAEYRLPADIARKSRFTGYLGRFPRPAEAKPRRRRVICTVGGGQDGFRLAATFARVKLPPSAEGVLVTGPFMPTEHVEAVRQQVAARDDITVLDFVSEPQALLESATDVIAMGGYNTVCEILPLRARALIVPRMRPRREQLIRVERMAELGLLDLLHPTKLDERALEEWLARSDRAELAPAAPIALDGLERIPDLLDGLQPLEETEAARAV